MRQALIRVTEWVASLDDDEGARWAEKWIRGPAQFAKRYALVAIDFVFNFIERAALASAVFAAALITEEKALAILGLAAIVALGVWLGIQAQSAFMHVLDGIAGHERMSPWVRGVAMLLAVVLGLIAANQISKTVGGALMGFLKQAEIVAKQSTPPKPPAPPATTNHPETTQKRSIPG